MNHPPCSHCLADLTARVEDMSSRLTLRVDAMSSRFDECIEEVVHLRLVVKDLEQLLGRAA